MFAHSVAADANVVKFDLCVTAGRIAVHGVEDAVDREAGRIQGVRAGKVLKKRVQRFGDPRLPPLGPELEDGCTLIPSLCSGILFQKCRSADILSLWKFLDNLHENIMYRPLKLTVQALVRG